MTAHWMTKLCGTLLALVMGGVAGTLAAQTAPPGLVAAYSFDEGSGSSANDGAGGNHTGSISGATWTTAGKYGSALSFSGTSWVTVADADDLDLTTGMTLEAWVFPTAAATASTWRNVIIKERTGGEVYNLYADTDTHVPAAYVVKSANPYSPIGANGIAQVPLNAWTHLAVTYDNANLVLYVNGSVVRSVATSGALLASTGVLRIGGNGVWGEFFQGMIDEVRIYNRALVQAEILADMATPLGLAPAPPPPPGADQLGQWSGVTQWPIVPIHASLLPTGEILSWDGFGFAPGSARLWNFQTGQFTSVPNGPNLFCAGHILMPDGRLLVLGGHVDVFVGIADTTIYDPATRTWSAAAPMNFPRWYPTVTALPDGRALVMSGNTDCETCIADVPEIYNPLTNSWSQLGSAKLGIPIYPYNFLLPNGKLLVAGAYHASMPTRVLDLASQTWQVVDPAQLDAGSAVMYAPGKIMKSGSSWESEPAITLSAATTYVFDSSQPTPTWRATAPMAFPRVFHNLTVLPDGSVLATGGSQTTDLYDLGAASLTAEMWSPTTETWTTMASAEVPRFYHSVALLLPDGRVWVAGGGRSGVDQLSAEIYSPPYLFKGNRPVISAAPSNVQYGANFSVQTPDAASIVKASLIPLGSVTHTFDMNQRFVPLSFQFLPGGIDIQAPANGNVAPPGYYMLFIVNDIGVPSLAAQVRLSGSTGDDQPPAVAITSPSAGQNVSGTITISANASDNVGVVGVQFKVDGDNLGAEVTTVPYSVSWSTLAVSGGGHTLTAVARDAAGNTTVSAPIAVSVAGSADTTPPSSPTAVTATAVSASQVNVAWNASTDNVGVTGYRVERCQGTGCTTFAQVATAAGTGFNDTGLAEGTSYSYRVLALDASGNQSTYSNVTSATTLPAPDTTPPTGPTGLTATAASTSQIDLGWTASTDNFGVTGYRVERCQGSTCTAFVEIAAPTGTSFSSTGLAAGTTYRFRVRATDAAGNLSAYSNIARTATLAADTTRPTAPTGLAATVASGSQINLVWNASTDNVGVTEYRVLRCQGTNCNSFAQIATSATTSFANTGLAAATTYRYRVRAVDAAGNVSTNSNTVSATTQATSDASPPTIPAGLTATAAGATQINLIWAAASDNVAVTGYRVERCQGAGCTAFAQVAAPTGTSFSNTGLNASTSYSYRVRAADAAGNLGAYSNIASDTTAAEPPDTTSPTAPTGLTATAASTSQVNLSWTASTDNVGVALYWIDRCEGAGCTTFAQVASSSTTTFSDVGLAAATTYSYRAHAADAVGNVSADSAIATVTTPAVGAIPVGLVAAYGFNEGAGTSAADATSQGHTGTISNATWAPAGRHGGALSFNGTNSWVTVADANDLDLTTGMTLEAWVYPTAAATASTWRNVIIKERAGGEVYNLYADIDAHVPTAYVVKSANPYTPIGADGIAQVPLNAWTHLAITYDNANLILYVDGTAVRTLATSGALLTSTGVLRIGGNSVWGEFFQGMIDEVRIYNRALTPAEIQADMVAPLSP